MAQLPARGRHRRRGGEQPLTLTLTLTPNPNPDPSPNPNPNPNPNPKPNPDSNPNPNPNPNPHQVSSQQAAGLRGWAAREWLCPPAQQLCGMSSAYWPHISSLSPTHGTAQGGLSLTLTGAEFRSMPPPVTLSLGLRDGTEIQTTALTVLNDTHIIATLPPWRGATAFAWADVALSDARGRTAFLYEAFYYEPCWQAYATTGALLMAALLAACYLLPAYLRRGCESSASSARSLEARRTRECV
jgi:hypothetical protein